MTPEFRAEATKALRRHMLRSPVGLVMLLMVVVAFAAAGWLVARGAAWAAPVLVVFVLVMAVRGFTRGVRLRIDQLFPEGATAAVALDGESLTILDAAGISSVIPFGAIASVDPGRCLVFLRLRDQPSAIAVPATLLDEADLAALARAASRG